MGAGKSGLGVGRGRLGGGKVGFGVGKRGLGVGNERIWRGRGGLGLIQKISSFFKNKKSNEEQ